MQLLNNLGERFVFEKGVLANKTFFIIDFYLPKPRKLCIEVDGRYHDNRKEYDAMKDEFLTKNRNFNVLRISNDAALAMDANELLHIINMACKRKE